MIIFGHALLFINVYDIAVAMFFFLSGYGLYTQLLKNGKPYLNGFLGRKVAPLLITYAAAMAVLLTLYLTTGLDALCM